MSINREDWYAQQGITPGEPTKKPQPLPESDTWAAEISDDDLKIVDPDALSRRLSNREEWGQYLTKRLEPTTKEFEERFEGMPANLKAQVSEKIGATVTANPELFWDKTQNDFYLDRLGELTLAAANEVCNQAHFTPRQPLEDYIAQRQAANPASAAAQLARHEKETK